MDSLKVREWRASLIRTGNIKVARTVSGVYGMKALSMASRPRKGCWRYFLTGNSILLVWWLIVVRMFLAIWNFNSWRPIQWHCCVWWRNKTVSEISWSLKLISFLFQIVTAHFSYAVSSLIVLNWSLFSGTVTKREEGRTSMLHFEMLIDSHSG